MAVLAECPVCHKKQTVRSKLCLCGEDLDKAKRSQKVRYWISYRLPGGKQKREAVGFSIEEARDAEGKRRSQKRENRIFDIVPEGKMTFQQLANWYTKLNSVKALKSYERIELCLQQFNSFFGSRLVNSIRIIDLEEYQAKRQKDGRAPATIDMEISIVKTMINKAFDNDMIGAHALKAFKKAKKLLKKNANVRDRILNRDEYRRLMERLPSHTRAIVTIAIHTGMRKGEILSLKWDKVDLKNRIIRLAASDTKDGEPRKIPISDDLYSVLKSIPRAIHDSHVILFDGKPVRDIRAALVTACRKEGIPYGRFVKGGFVFHDFRHTFNTNMRKAGVAQSVIMKITGHSTNEMFERYNTVDEDDIRLAVDQMEGYLKSVDQNVDQAADSPAIKNKKD